MFVPRAEFSLATEFLAEYKDTQPEWGPLGYLVYKRTYANKLDDGTTEEFWQTCQRVVDGIYQIQKGHCQGQGLPWSDTKAQRSAQEAYQRMFAFKWLPPGRGLAKMGTEHVFKIGGACLNNPLHGDTKVLTRDYGWVPIKTLSGTTTAVLSNTKLYGRDHKQTDAKSVWVDAEFSDYEEHSCLEISFRDQGKVTRSIISSVNHRWFRRTTTKKPWERVTAEELRVGDYMPTCRPTINFKPSPVGAQHGLFFGDGTRSNGELHQFGDSIPVLRRLFTNIQDLPKTEDDCAHAVVRQCPDAWGSLPCLGYSNDKSYALGFLQGYFAADGKVTGNSDAPSAVLSSSRKDELERVVALAADIGIRMTPPRLDSDSSNYSDSRELWASVIYRSDVPAGFFLKANHAAKWVPYTERRDFTQITDVQPAGVHRVYCCVVPKYEQFTVDGFVLTSNCGFTSTRNIGSTTLESAFSDPFIWLMDMSMLGVGVGFDTEGAGQVTLQKPKHSAVHQIADSREGWVAYIEQFLQSYADPDVPLPEPDYSLIRPKGAPIRGFGGTASGPESMQLLTKRLTKLLNLYDNKKVDSRCIVDIANSIGECVVAGGVRRTAEISFGSPEDAEFLALKDFAGNPDANEWARWASNNSVIVDTDSDFTVTSALTSKNGEPGYLFLRNAQEFGRMIDPPNGLDHGAEGANPCVEQTLWDHELCCLVETFPSNCDDFEDYRRTLKFAYLYAKTVTMVPTHNERTNAVMLRNRRIGCSQTGIQDNISKIGLRKHLEWCDKGYKYIRELDEIYSNWLCIRTSIKMTSVKPSGSVSKLPGVREGIHEAKGEYEIQSIRINDSSPLLARLEEAGYLIEDAIKEPNTKVVYFPMHYPGQRSTPTSMWEQLELAALMQAYWADNQVSVTIDFDPETEGPQIQRALEMYAHRLKGLSFMPRSNHGYEQPPKRVCDQAEYEKYKASLTPYSFEGLSTHEVEDKFCDGGLCEIPSLAPGVSTPTAEVPAE